MGNCIFMFFEFFIYNFNITLYNKYNKKEGDAMNEYLIFQLKEGRRKKGLKQSDVTKYTGIKNTTLSNYENGVTEPDIDTFLQLCKLYELNYAEIIGEAYGIGIPYKSLIIHPSEIKFLKKYQNLDGYGKETMNIIIDRETQRAATQREKDERLRQLEFKKLEQPVPMRLISYYFRNASAGSGQLVIDNLPEKDIEIPDIPKYKNVSYAIGVNGSSMEPAYYDGDVLLVEATRELELGEIGIFQINGECYVKKLGQTELISLNRAFANVPLDESAQTMGRVIGKL